MSLEHQLYQFQDQVPVSLDERVDAVLHAPGDLILNLDRVHRYKAGLENGVDLVERTRQRIGQLAVAPIDTSRRLFLVATGGSCEGKTSYLADWAHSVRAPEQVDKTIDLLQPAYPFSENERIYVRYAAFSWSALVDAVVRQGILPSKKGAWSSRDLFFLNNLFFVSMTNIIEEREERGSPDDIYLYSVDLPCATGFFDQEDRKKVHGRDRGLTVLRRLSETYGAKQLMGLSVVCSNEAFFRNLSIRNIHHTRDDQTSALLVPLGDMQSFRLMRTTTAPVDAALTIRGQIQAAVIAYHGEDVSYSYSLAAPLYAETWKRLGMQKSKKAKKPDFLIGDTSMDVVGMPWYDAVQSNHDQFMSTHGHKVIKELSGTLIARRLIEP